MKIDFKSKKFLIISGLALGVLLLIFLFIFIPFQINVPLSSQTSEQVFSIERNQGLRTIASNLEKDSLIRSNFWFVLYVYTRGWASKLQAGDYALNPSLSIAQIAEKMAKGDVVFNHVKVTIPEGFNIKQVDQRLTEAGLIKSRELVDNYSHLEGYLFPDTYIFDKSSNLEEITAKIVSNFNKKLTKSLHDAILNQGKTISDIVIMASIIEKEAHGYQDSRVVSGIFWKRIKNNYPLQSCATIAYVTEENKGRYSIEETKIDSPYNTYQNVGLPPGPICSPGLLAIQAAIYPLYTDYNFFLSPPSSNQTVFSKTYEEHLANKAKYFK